MASLIKHLLHQYNRAILVGILLATVYTSGIVLGATNTFIHEPLAIILQPAQADLLLVPFDQLSREAELIILGHVLDEKLIWEGSVGAALENHTMSIEKVLKGSYNGNKIGVITESQSIKDSPKFKQNERVILFLYKKPLFVDKPSGNDYTVAHYSQGKYEVTDNGLVRGLDIVNDMPIADFEKKITDALSNPKTNNTQVSSDADY